MSGVEAGLILSARQLNFMSAIDQSGGKMIRGLCQMHDRWLGTGVRVHGAAGDAAPFLTREMYEMLKGQPAFEALPSQRKYECLEERMAREHPWQW